MRFPRRILFARDVPTLALLLLLSATLSPAGAPAAQISNAATAPADAGSQNPPAVTPAASTTEIWNEAAGTLAAKIIEHVTSGDALALMIKNLSTLGDDDVVQVRRALRTQLRNRKVRLTGSKQASADVQVTLSENAEGYLWIAEIRNHTSTSAAGEDMPNPVVMVSVGRAAFNDRHAPAETLTIRKTRFYQQSDPMLDVALLDNPPAGSVGSPAPANLTARILVLGLATVSLDEHVKTLEAGGKGEWQWQAKQTAALTRLHPWPRDARGRLVLRNDSLFDVYLPGTKCSGALEPTLTLECHESDEPWPLNVEERDSNVANPGVGLEAAAYYMAERNYFDGRIKLDGGNEVTLPPFLAVVAVPPSGAAHAGLPIIPAAVPSGAPAIAGWILSGLDGHTQILSSHALQVANVGGWGSQIAGLQSGCGAGWQVLASQAEDFNQPDAVQAYEIVNRKPVPVSPPVDFAGPITELWPLAQGGEAMAISHNLQAEVYEAYRLSISCGR